MAVFLSGYLAGSVVTAVVALVLALVAWNHHDCAQAQDGEVRE